jgi:hypothetical protein
MTFLQLFGGQTNMLLRCFQKISLFNFTHPRNGIVTSRGEAVFLFVLLVRACPLMAQSGHSILHRLMSAFGSRADMTIALQNVR